MNESGEKGSIREMIFYGEGGSTTQTGHEAFDLEETQHEV